MDQWIDGSMDGRPTDRPTDRSTVRSIDGPCACARQFAQGSPEEVQKGSTQFTPSDPKYNTAVDNLAAPRRYVVWSTDMNQRILPKYVVSFSLVPQK